MEERRVVGLAARDKTGVLSPYSYNLRSSTFCIRLCNSLAKLGNPNANTFFFSP